MPTVPPPDGVVEMLGFACPMTTFSSSQPEETGLFMASPLYVAIHRHVPTLSVVKGVVGPAEPATRPSVSVYLAVWVASTTQVGLSGSNSTNVTVPVGLNPPETVAESWIPIPTVPPADW